MAKIDFLKLAKQAQKIAEDKKGENVIIVDVTGQTAIANYFVIITAVSVPQINAIANEIEKSLKYDFGVAPLRREGAASQTWKVIDFGGLLVHVMYPEIRVKYNLEKIWNAYGNQPAEKKVTTAEFKKTVYRKKTVKNKIFKKKCKNKNKKRR